MSLKKNIKFTNNTWYNKRNERLKNQEEKTLELESSKTNSVEKLS